MQTPGVLRRWSAIGAFVWFGVLSGLSFVSGAVTSHVALDDPWNSCVIEGTEALDRNCVRNLATRTPMEPGAAAFAFSVVFGVAALLSLAMRPGTARVVSLTLGVLFLCGWTLLLVWNAHAVSKV